MKKIIKITSVIVVILIVICSSIFACRKRKGNNNSEKESSSISVPEATWTENDLVKKGETEYTAVLPDNAIARENKAYDELNTFFFQATGAVLDLKKESQVTYSDNAKLIILGDCNDLLSKAGVSVDKDEIGINGYVMKTVESNLFIVGGTQYGTLFGVYEFLRLTFDYEIYAADEIVIETGVLNKKLINVDMVKVPDVQQLWANYGELWTDTEYALRLGFEQSSEIFISPNGHNVHNFYEYVNPDIWQEDYPEWFRNGQLCLSNEEMYEKAMLPAVKEWIAATPNTSNISITQRDVNDWCDCDKCLEEHEKYGTDAGIMIKFINKISRDVNAWLKDVDPERKVTFLFFAYHQTTTTPPVKRNPTTGEYEAIDKDVICEDDVAVFFAPIYSKFVDSYYKESNVSALVAAEGWRAICKTMFVWAYETNFSQYLVPYNTFNSIQDNYKFYKEYNVKMLFSQGQHNQNAATGFSNLKMWLNSKFRWDVNADYNALIDEYFEHYFAEGAEGMREYFENLRLWFDYQENVIGIEGGIYGTSQTKKYWSKGILDSFSSSINKALKAIEPLKQSAPERYQQLYDRIALESFSVRFLLEKIYSSEFSEEELYQLRKGMKDDIQRLGITRVRETQTIDELYSNWNV